VQTLPTSEIPRTHAPPPPPNRQQRPIRLRQSLEAVSNELLLTTNEISRDVADDIVSWAIGHGSNPRNDYAKTMRRMVSEILDKHSSLFRGLVARLDTSSLDLANSITAVADEEFGDGEANWGRIVALCAFVARLAQHFKENQETGDRGDVLANFLRTYFCDRLNAWIATQGGWDQFTRRFAGSQLESKIFKGLLATGLAFGVLAGVIAMR